MAIYFREPSEDTRQVQRSHEPTALTKQCLDVLRSPDALSDERLRAFERLVEEPDPLWSGSTIGAFTQAAGLLECTRSLGPGYADRIDTEGLAAEALAIFYYGAPTIIGSVRTWVWGVVKTLVHREIKSRYEEITASEIPSSLPALTPDAVAAPARDFGGAFAEAVQRLPDSLRAVAELRFFGGLDRETVRERVKLTREAFRQRDRRMLAALRKLLLDQAAPPHTPSRRQR